MEEKRKRACICNPWKQFPGPSGYCPDIRHCLYVQTRLKVRNLQQRRYRRFDLLLPKPPPTNDFKDAKHKLDGLKNPYPLESLDTIETQDKEDEDEFVKDEDFQKGFYQVPASSPASPFYSESLETRKLEDERIVKQEQRKDIQIKNDISSESGKDDPDNLGKPTSVSFWIEQSPDDLNLGEDGTGSVVWGPGIMMLDFLSGVCRAAGSLVLENKRVVELGAGTGVCSIAASLCGASLLLATDRFAQLTKKNLERLGLTPSPITVAEHTWGENLPQLGNYLTALFSNSSSSSSSTSTTTPFHINTPPIDIILLADVLYFSTYYKELLSSILYISEFGVRTQRSGNFLANMDNQLDGKEIYDDLYFYFKQQQHQQQQYNAYFSSRNNKPKNSSSSPFSSSSSSLGSTLYPFIILAHKKRSIETEHEFFREISKDFRIFQVLDTPLSSSVSPSMMEWKNYRYRYLDGQDPNLELLILIHQNMFIKNNTIKSNNKSEEDDDRPLILKRTKSLEDHPSTNFRKKRNNRNNDSKITKNFRKSDSSSKSLLREIMKVEQLKITSSTGQDVPVENRLTVEEVFREHWFFQHIQHQLVEYVL